MDKIRIINLMARGIIGIHEWEREKPQNILINIDLYVAKRKAGTPDNIQECVDYSKLVRKVINHAEKANKYTLEALADDIAEVCLEDSRVLKTTVRVEKPGAVRFTDSVGVEIERDRNTT